VVIAVYLTLAVVAFTIGMLGASLIVVVRGVLQEEKRMGKLPPSPTHRRVQRWAALWAQGITGLAVLLAGRKRASVRDEWRSHLAGLTGRGLPPKARIGAALGFIVAAVSYRLEDAANVGWNLADAVLKSRKASNVVVVGPTGLAALMVIHSDGIVKTLASFGGIAAIGGLLYALIRVGRWYRNVKPPEPKARRLNE
jgi:hypothetical protein